MSDITYPPAVSPASIIDIGDTLALAATTSPDFSYPPGYNYYGAIGDGAYGGADVDLFRFDLAAGEQVTIDIDADTSEFPPLDSVLRVFDATGTQLAVSDDDVAPDDWYVNYQDSFIRFTAPVAGSYYAGVSGNKNFTYDPLVENSGTWGGTGAYAIHIALADQPGDSIFEALDTGLGPLTPADYTVTQVLGDGGSGAADVDFFSFQLDPGQAIAINVSADQFGIDIDPALRLFDIGGNQVAANDDRAGPGEPESRDPFLAFRAPDGATGTETYYAAVSGYPNLAYDPNTAGSGGEAYKLGDYDLQIGLLDEPETGDTLNTATALPPPGPFPQDNFIAYLGDGTHGDKDVDIYSVDLTTGQQFVFDVDAFGIGYGTNSILRLIDAGGTQLAISDDNAAPGEPAGPDPFIDFTAVATGAYYIGVSGFENIAYDPTSAGSGSAGHTGFYHYSLSYKNPADHGDTLPLAVETGLSTTAPGQFVVTGSIGDSAYPDWDVDLFKFQLDAGHSAALDIGDTGIPLNVAMRLFDSTGNELAIANDYNPGGNDPGMLFTAPASGIYYVGISGYGNEGYDPNVEASGSPSPERGDYGLGIEVGGVPTAGDDLLIGTNAADLISALGGNDTVSGWDGNDTLRGGLGDDDLDGMDGDDFLEGINGADTLRGGDGNDLLLAGADNDALLGDPGNDTLYGGPGSDYLDGGDDNDQLDGGDGSDTLKGQTGDDVLLAGADDDVLFGDDGADLLIGAAGADLLRGGIGDDTLDGGTGNDTLVGEEGHDQLLGGADSDVLMGSSGNDTLYGALGDDFLFGGKDADTLRGADGNDTVHGDRGSDRIEGNLGSDTLTGGNGDDTVLGGDQEDTLAGGNGDDQLHGGAGDDLIAAGNDNDAIHGDAGNDTLFGEAGNDNLLGGGGDDLLLGGSGDDSLFGAADADTFAFDGGVGDLGNDSILDLVRGSDKIQFSGFGPDLNSFDDLDTSDDGTLDAADADITISGTHTLIDLTAATAGVVAGDLTIVGVTGLEATDLLFT